MNTKMKKILRTVAMVIIALMVVGGGVWMITGRSPMAIIVKSALHQMDTESYDKAMADKTDKSTTEIPAGVVFPREAFQYTIGNMQVFEVPAENDTKPVVLYLHGGAYVHNFTSQHWKAMAEWAKTTGCGIVAPNYPLLPLHTAAEAHPLMLRLYRDLLKGIPASRVLIMGDSAGGGFTLALAQQIRHDSLDLPRRLVLISPWVDVMGGDPSLQGRDNWLTIDVLQKYGTAWAGQMDVSDPVISPLYGDMEGLPPTDLFTGTWEVFYTDVCKTYDKMKAAGVDVRLHVAEKMGHVYPLWPSPEGRKACHEIAKIIKTCES
jgi:acetyl esterase/lipase